MKALLAKYQVRAGPAHTYTYGDYLSHGPRVPLGSTPNTRMCLL
ncbi:hypothetical protein [Telluribacter humicola]|nr:hypothetical protein [Telluribacter humicola]